MGLLVRPAACEDVDAIVAMGARMHAGSAYSFLPYDSAKVRRCVLDHIAHPESLCALVAVEGGVPVGMMGGYISDYFFCDEKIACDMVIYVEPGRRGTLAAVRLIGAFREWAAARGAREICLGISTGRDTERTGRFYERLGLRAVGGVYKQRLDECRGGARW
jgi:GNAT superfamily N-acetyltransferase